MYTASVDCGNGTVNALLDKGRGKPKQLSFPSVRSRIVGQSLGLQEMELEYQKIGWSGRQFVVGDEATQVSRNSVERHTGTSNRYGNEFHRHLVATAIARMGVKKGGVSLITYVPPGFYNEIKEQVRERFLKEPNVQIKLDGTMHEFTYSDVTVFPEALAAIGCFTIDNKYNPQNADDILNGDVLILDMGSYTLDTVLLTNGKINPEAGRFTYEDGGIDSLIRQPLLTWLREQHDDFSLLSVEDIDRIIINGSDDANYVMRSGSASLDLSEPIDQLRREYADWVSNVVVDSDFRELRGVNKVLMVGGGAILAGSRLREFYGDKILDTNSHTATKKISPTDFIAVGGLRLAMMRQKAMA